jgi:hypothetical protein
MLGGGKINSEDFDLCFKFACIPSAQIKGAPVSSGANKWLNTTIALNLRVNYLN